MADVSELQKQLKQAGEDAERNRKALERARREIVSLKSEIEAVQADSASAHKTIMEMQASREAMSGSIVVTKKAEIDSSARTAVDTPVELGSLPAPIVSVVPQDAVVIAAAEKKIAAKEQEIEKQKKQLQEAVRQILVLKKNIEVKGTEFAAVEKQLRDTEQERDEIRSAKEKALAEAAVVLKQAQEIAEQQSVAASEQLAARNSRISDLESELRRTEASAAATLKAEKAEAAKQAKIAAERLAAREQELTTAIGALQQEKEAIIAKLNEATTELERRSTMMAEQEEELERTSTSLAEARERSAQLSREKAQQQEIFRAELGQAVEKYSEILVAYKAKCEECERYSGTLARFAASPQRPSVKSRLSASDVVEEDELNVSRILTGDVGTGAAVDSSIIPVTPTRLPAPTKM